MSLVERGRRSKVRRLPPSKIFIESRECDLNDLVRIVLGALESLKLSEYRKDLEQETGISAASEPFQNIERDINSRNWPNAYILLDNLSFNSKQAESSAREMLLSQWVTDLVQIKDYKGAIKCIRNEVRSLDTTLAEKLSCVLFEAHTVYISEEVLDFLAKMCTPDMFVSPNRLERLLKHAQLYENYENKAKPIIRGSNAEIGTVLVHALNAIGSTLGDKLAHDFSWGLENLSKSQLETYITSKDWTGALQLINEPSMVGLGANCLFEDVISQKEASKLILGYAVNDLSESPKKSIALVREYASADHELVGSLLLGTSNVTDHQFTEKLYKLLSNHMISSSYLISQVLTLGARFEACVDPYWSEPNLETQTILREIRAPTSSLPEIRHQSLYHDDEVWDVAFSPDGNYLASGTRSGTLYIWKLYGDRYQQDSIYRNIHNDHIQSLDWSHDSTRVLSGGRDGYAVVVDVALKRKVTTVICADSDLTDIAAVCWVCDGTSFFAGSYDGKLVRWSADGSTETLIKYGFRVLSMVLSDSGSKLVVLSVQMKNEGRTSHLLNIFDVATNALVEEIEIYAALTSIAVSSIGYHAVNVIPEGVKLWHPSSKQEAKYLEGPKQQQYKIRSNFGGPFGKYLVSGSEDCTIRIFNTVTKVLISELSGHTDVVNTVKWSPTRPMIASASDDRYVCIWVPKGTIARSES